MNQMSLLQRPSEASFASRSTLNSQAIVCLHLVSSVFHQDRRPSIQIHRLLHANRKASARTSNSPLTRQGKSIFGDEIGNEPGVRRKYAAIEGQGTRPREHRRAAWLQHKA